MRKGMEFTALDDLVGAIYDAAMAPDGWPAVMGRIRTELAAHASQLWTPLAPPEAGGFSFSHSIDESVRGDYLAYYHRHDLWNRGALDNGFLRDGNAFVDTQLVPEADFRRSEIWADFFRRQDIYRFCGGVVHDGHSGGAPVTAICCYRGVRDAPFDEADRALVVRLLPHLRRALAMQARLAPAQSPAELALETLALPVLVLAADARVLFANPAAICLAGGDRAVRLSKGRLRLADGAAQRRLEDVLRHAATGFRRLAGAAAFSVKKANGHRLVFSFAPARPGSLPDGRAAAVVFIRAADAATLGAAELRAIYGLTATEASLALVLLDGGTVGKHAAARGVSVHTVRSQLKGLLEKTGTARQADLVRVLLSGHAPTG